MSGLRAVLFDVDFTIAKPGPLLGPEGYRAAGERHGLELDSTRYANARAAAVEDLEHHPDLIHDEEVWWRFTEDILRGMGADGPAVRQAALDITAEWLNQGNFELYDDALPVLSTLRNHDLKLGLVSNTSRDLDAFVRHFSIEVDAWISSGAHGWVKPSPSIFQAVLDLLDVEPEESVMVGDSLSDDVEGARALGIRAFLLDRENRYPTAEGRLKTLLELPDRLGLRSGAA